MVFQGHLFPEGDDQDACLEPLRMCVGPGQINVINGHLTGQYELEGGFCGKKLLGGDYCTNMAMEAGRYIPEKFIEPATVTVKQLPMNTDLAIVKEADAEVLHVGENVTFTITLTNNGPSDATSIMVYDLLPAGLHYQASTASQGWYDVISGYWNVGDLADGDMAELTIVAMVNVDFEVCNRAIIVAADQHDPLTGNNMSEACVTGNPSNPHANRNLDTGFNLISLSILPENPNAATLMAGLDFLQVAQYVADGDPTPTDWFYLNPAPAPSDLTNMNDGWGYWVNMNAPGTLVYEGYQVARPGSLSLPPEYEVIRGWNLIGFTSVIPKMPSEYLGSIAGTYGSIYGFEDGIYFIVGTPGHEYMQMGYGYWIAIYEAGTIYP